MSDKQQSLQDKFLNTVRRDKATVTVFLVNGVKLQGMITWFDSFSILLKRESHVQLIYKHAVSTIMPATPIRLYNDIGDGSGKEDVAEESVDE